MRAAQCILAMSTGENWDGKIDSVEVSPTNIPYGFFVVVVVVV